MSVDHFRRQLENYHYTKPDDLDNLETTTRRMATALFKTQHANEFLDKAKRSNLIKDVSLQLLCSNPALSLDDAIKTATDLYDAKIL